MKSFLLCLFTASLLILGSASASAQTAPKTVIHVVTVKWKSPAPPEQIQAALAGVQALPASFKGITRVWIKSIKVQGEVSNAFVMEFASEDALKQYSGSDAQKAWYQVSLPIRESSTTFDITN